MQLISANTNIDFIGRRKIAFAISGLMILISLIALGAKGLNWGIDFAGGTIVEVRLEQPKPVGDLRDALETAKITGSSIQHFGTDTEFLIRMPNEEGADSGTISTKVLAALEAGLGKGQVELRRVEFVGPAIGKELAEKGVMAVLYAMVAILFYVAWRFELRFALGADLALLHDVTITLGVFAITGKEFTLPVVAAVLTIIGYSLNDTIVVFDRIRETMIKLRKRPLAEIMNKAVNETLSRTVMTSLTTILVLVALFFLGGEIIHDFAFALLIGVGVGTYSSIFVAAPVVLAMEGKRQPKLPGNDEEGSGEEQSQAS